jgi:hypothetical protein
MGAIEVRMPKDWSILLIRRYLSSPLRSGHFMSDIAALPTIPCPNCRQPMLTQDLERINLGTVRVELCFGCAGIWFDHLASVELAPAAVIELFKEIQSHRDDARQPEAKQLTCPRCDGTLVLSFDLSKSGRFSYFRCSQGDGRFTPFFQFLREKQFVRSLTPAELQRVKSQVRQINCSQCGAPIDLEHSSECRFCHAPVSFLDPGAVEKAVQMWSEAESRRHAGATPEALGNALVRMRLPQQQSGSPGAQLGHLLDDMGAHGTSAGAGLDLVAMGIHAIGRLFERG